MKFSELLKNIPGVSRLISALGIDKAIFYNIISVLWSSVAGIIAIYFIVSYLTLAQQGYWYTFISLGALATFAELGFTTIITQFISHEYAHLKEENGKLTGDPTFVERAISLVRFSLKFYLVVTTAAFIFLSIVGILFLMSSTNDLYLFMAWVAYSFTGAFLLLVSLFGAVLKGFNKVDVVQKNITIAAFVSNVATWIALYAGYNIWALAVGGIVNIILSLFLFIHSFRPLWDQIFHTKIEGSYNWLKETLPLQWRYAISWGSGYFIFQFIVPVTMFYAGPDIAGKLGLSLVIARAVQNIANSWGMTKVPQFNIYVAQKKRYNLDKLLENIQKQSLLVFVAGSLVVVVILIYAFPILNWDTRILPIYEIVIILIAEGANLVVFNWAYYLRSHKKEPYVRISAVSAVLIGVGVWLGMYLTHSTLVVLSIYCIIALVMLIPAWRIFKNESKRYMDNYYNQDDELLDL
jgi:O-antigen/teichoic acid export membrane protein